VAIFRLDTKSDEELYIIWYITYMCGVAIFRLDTKSDEKLYIIWYITYISVV